MLCNYPSKTYPRVIMAGKNRDYDDWEAALRQAGQFCRANPGVRDVVMLVATGRVPRVGVGRFP